MTNTYKYQKTADEIYEKIKTSPRGTCYLKIKSGWKRRSLKKYFEERRFLFSEPKKNWIRVSDSKKHSENLKKIYGNYA